MQKKSQKAQTVLLPEKPGEEDVLVQPQVPGTSFLNPEMAQLVNAGARMLSGTSKVEAPWMTGEIPGLAGADVYGAANTAANVANNKAWADTRKLVYTTIARQEDENIANFLGKALKGQDQEQIRGIVSTVQGLKRAIAANPMLASSPMVRKLSWLQDNAAVYTKKIMEGAAGAGMNFRNTDEATRQRFGVVAASVASGMMTTELGIRRGSDVASFLRDEISAGSFNGVVNDPRAFIRDASGSVSLDPRASKFIETRVRRKIGAAEGLARVLGQANRPLSKVWNDFGQQVLGRPMQESDLKDVYRLQASMQAAGVKDVTPHLLRTMQRLQAAGIPRSQSLKYVTHAMGRYAASVRSNYAGGGTAQTAMGQGMMGVSADDAIDHFVGMQVAAPVAGENSLFTAGAVVLKQKGDKASYNQFMGMLAKGAPPQVVKKFLAGKGALLDPRMASRLAYTRSGESAYTDIMDAGGSTFMMRGLHNAVVTDVGRQVGRSGVGRTPKDLANRMWMGYSGQAPNRSGTGREAMMNAAIFDATEAAMKRYGIPGGRVMSAVVGSPGYLANSAAVDRSAAVQAGQDMSTMMPTAETPDNVRDLVRRMLGGRQRVTFGTGAEPTKGSSKGNPYDRFKDKLLMDAPATAAPAVAMGSVTGR